MCLGKIQIVKKIAVALAIVFTISVLSSSQDAWALSGNCAADGVLLPTEMYVSDNIGDLYKIETSDGSSCLVASMGIFMTDLALDANNQKLYGIDQSPQCYQINRITGATTAGSAPIMLGALLISDLNSFEIDPAGNAWVAGMLGNLYTMNVSTCALTFKTNLSTAVTAIVRASGDLMFDLGSNNDLYLTSFDCDNCSTGNDGLYKIFIPTLTTTFVADTGFKQVFAGDFISATQTMCFVTQTTELFELDKAGVNKMNGPLIHPTFLDTAVQAFGGTGIQTFVGGIGLTLDKTALFMAAMELSSFWVAPFVLVGLGLVAFKLSRKSSLKNQKY